MNLKSLLEWAGRQPKLLLAAAAALLLLGWIIYVPPVLAIRSAGLRWSELKAETKESRGLMDSLRQGKFRMLVAREDLPGLLQQIHAHARECQVELREVSPAEMGEGTPAKPILLPVEIQLYGEFRSIGEFLGKLRQDPALGVITVRQLRISREDRLLPRLRAQLSIQVALRQGDQNET